jgi:hypothetical protein
MRTKITVAAAAALLLTIGLSAEAAAPRVIVPLGPGGSAAYPWRPNTTISPYWPGTYRPMPSYSPGWRPYPPIGSDPRTWSPFPFYPEARPLPSPWYPNAWQPSAPSFDYLPYGTRNP